MLKTQHKHAGNRRSLHVNDQGYWLGQDKAINQLINVGVACSTQICYS